ncbi:hypothetical protein BJY00DRAFT_315415 [Aspergillus carlsbadensis]|nr:hypothetical protein BJY00DRAFT_315415 [Aspergillus carlsbadensis]
MNQPETAISSVSLTILLLMLICMGLRLLVRVHLLNRYGVDDAIATVSFVLASAVCITILVAVKTAVFVSVDLALAKKRVLVVLATCLIKVSFGLTLAPLLRKWLFVYVLYTAGALVSGFSAFYFIWGLVQCAPFHSTPNPDNPLCLTSENMIIASYTHAAVLITTDVVLASSSIAVIATLNMKTQTKVSVALLMLLGASTLIATIVRAAHIHELRNLDHGPFAAMQWTVWTTIEMGACIIATAMMTLRPLAAKLGLLSSHHTASAPRYPSRREQRASHTAATTSERGIDLRRLARSDDGIRVETTLTVIRHSGEPVNDEISVRGFDKWSGLELVWIGRFVLYVVQTYSVSWYVAKGQY